jgi:biopolymer transport protein ExbD
MKRVAVKPNRGMGGKFVARKKGSPAKDLNITSLIDILTILLVFMIKNIAMDSTQKTPPQGMQLPTTVSKNALIESGQAVFVKIYPDKVLYGTDNIEVGSLQDFMNKAEIRQTLLNFLRLEATQIKQAEKKPCLLIQADKTLECRYITEFIKFSANASFANIYFSAIHTDNKQEVLGL